MSAGRGVLVTAESKNNGAARQQLVERYAAAVLIAKAEGGCLLPALIARKPRSGEMDCSV